MVDYRVRLSLSCRFRSALFFPRSSLLQGRRRMCRAPRPEIHAMSQRVCCAAGMRGFVESKPAWRGAYRPSTLLDGGACAFAHLFRDHREHAQVLVAEASGCRGTGPAPPCDASQQRLRVCGLCRRVFRREMDTRVNTNWSYCTETRDDRYVGYPRCSVSSDCPSGALTRATRTAVRG